MGEIETGFDAQSESPLKRVLERLDQHYIPDQIRQIHERNQQLWQTTDIEDFNSRAGHWMREIRYGTGESRGLEALRGQADHPHVSIVIPAHNEEKNLLQILQSIASQDYDKGIEVIVVDNNSSPEDRGAEWAELSGARVIKYTLNEDNPDKKLSQIALARQKGLEASRGDIIISTDGDTIASKGWISQMTQPLDADQNVTAVAGGIAHYERDEVPHAGLTDIARAKTRPLKVIKLNATNPEDIPDTETQGVTPGANTAFRKVDALEIGGYDLRIYPGEDTNLGLRLLRMGKIKYVGNEAATVRVSPRRYAGLRAKDVRAARKRGVDAQTMLYLDETGQPIIKR